MVRKIYFSLMSLIFLSLFWLILFKGYGLRINQSESLPQKIFLSREAGYLYRGIYVSFSHPKFPNILIAKQVIGLPGDSIEVRNSQIFVHDTYLGDIKERSNSGKIYTPISHKRIPTGYLFLSSTHEDSFDSRYEEFGLIPQEAIIEELWPLF